MTKNPWVFIQECDEYTDYETYVPDHGGYGVRLRVCFNVDDHSAWMELVVDDENGSVFVERHSIPIPWDVAAAMTGHPRPASHVDAVRNALFPT